MLVFIYYFNSLLLLNAPSQGAVMATVVSAMCKVCRPCRTMCNRQVFKENNEVSSSHNYNAVDIKWMNV